jgi:hypothetical protein
MSERMECTCGPLDPASECLVHDGPRGTMTFCPECGIPIPVRKYPAHFHDHAVLAERKVREGGR